MEGFDCGGRVGAIALDSLRQNTPALTKKEVAER
jgi:hypothetical protein